MNNGEIVEHVIRRNNISISELSRRLHVSRRSIYNWFTQKNLSYDTIREIGEALDYDFSTDFPDKFNNGRKNPSMNGYQTDLNFDDYQNSANYWRNKYINLLEKFNGVSS